MINLEYDVLCKTEIKKEQFASYALTAKNYLEKLFGNLDNLDSCEVEIFDISKWDGGCVAGRYIPGRNKIELPYHNSEDEFLDTLVHEMNHQILHDRIQNPPRWFSEGLAQYHSVFNRNVIIGNIKLDKLLEIKSAADEGNLISLEDLVIKNRGFEGCTKSLAYAESWSFVHFLMNQEIFFHLAGKYALTHSFVSKSEVRCLESKWIDYLNEIFKIALRRRN